MYILATNKKQHTLTFPIEFCPMSHLIFPSPPPIQSNPSNRCHRRRPVEILPGLDSPLFHPCRPLPRNRKDKLSNNRQQCVHQKKNYKNNHLLADCAQHPITMFTTDHTNKSTPATIVAVSSPRSCMVPTPQHMVARNK